MQPATCTWIAGRRTADLGNAGLLRASSGRRPRVSGAEAAGLHSRDAQGSRHRRRQPPPTPALVAPLSCFSLHDREQSLAHGGAHRSQLSKPHGTVVRFDQKAAHPS